VFLAREAVEQRHVDLGARMVIGKDAGVIA
jgi:hypothetical protein